MVRRREASARLVFRGRKDIDFRMRDSEEIITAEGLEGWQDATTERMDTTPPINADIQRVAKRVAITTRNRLIVKARTDIINYVYIQRQDVWELVKREEAKNSRKQIMNIYDNHLGADQIWGEVLSTSRRWTLADVS